MSFNISHFENRWISHSFYTHEMFNELLQMFLGDTVFSMCPYMSLQHRERRRDHTQHTWPFCIRFWKITQSSCLYFVKARLVCSIVDFNSRIHLSLYLDCVALYGGFVSSIWRWVLDISIYDPFITDFTLVRPSRLFCQHTTVPYKVHTIRNLTMIINFYIIILICVDNNWNASQV